VDLQPAAYPLGNLTAAISGVWKGFDLLSLQVAKPFLIWRHLLLLLFARLHPYGVAATLSFNSSNSCPRM
jgi:hypothetical protein